MAKAKTREEIKAKAIEKLLKKTPEQLAESVYSLQESLEEARKRIDEEELLYRLEKDRANKLEETVKRMKEVIEHHAPKPTRLIIRYYGENCEECHGECFKNSNDPVFCSSCPMEDMTETASFYTFRITSEHITGVLTDFTLADFGCPEKVIDADTGAVLYEQEVES